MESVLIVLDDDSVNNQLLQTAKRHVTGTDLRVVVCRIVDQSEYQDSVKKKAKSHEKFDSIEATETQATEEAEEIAAEFFDDSIPYEPVGVVGSVPEDVLSIAAEMESIHIFIAGAKRSPAGKVLFGDNAQKLILDFDGPVSIITETR
jgi:nucleotide-binding universal stress UspA family protein